LEKQQACRPFCLARESAGRSMPDRIAMMAITTSNSISVKPFRDESLVINFMAFQEYTLPEKDRMQQTGQIPNFGPADACGRGRQVPNEARSFAAREKPY